MPIASLIASEIDFGEGCVVDGGKEERDENAQDAANVDPGDGPEKPRKQAIGVSSAVSSGRVLSEGLEIPAVKQLVAAAKLARVSENAAGQAAALAARAWDRGDSMLALGGVELVQLLGFQGVTLRGKSKAGANTFVVAIDKLKQMHQETEMSKDTAVMDTNENRDITDGGVSGASDVEPAKVVVVVLVEKLKALFPPAPRVTFDDSF